MTEGAEGDPSQGHEQNAQALPFHGYDPQQGRVSEGKGSLCKVFLRLCRG